VGSDQQLIRLATHDESRFNALFYSSQEAPSTISQPGVITFLKQVVSSVVNGLAYEGMSSAYSWLARLHRSTVLGVFQSLPNEIMNVLRQRVRAQAVSNDDLVIVQAMLELGYDVRADDPFPDSDVSSVLQGLRTPDCGLEKAQGLVKYALRMSSSPDKVLETLLCMFPKSYASQKNINWDKDGILLMRIAFEAGAVAIPLCFLAAKSNVSALEELATVQGRNIFHWV
jgi:hypothetical protein